MYQNMTIIETCDCPIWAKPLVEDIFRRTDIHANEIVIWDMDYKHISLSAEVWDKNLAPDAEGDEPGGWVEKQYRVRYYEDGKDLLRMLLSYRFYDCEEVTVEEVLPDGKVVRYLAPTYLDKGAYRVYGYWYAPSCVHIDE